MNEGRDIWQKYCGFFDKNFSEQLEYSQKKKEEYFEKWKKTKMAKQLCPKGARVFEDIPLTTYDDYPILHKFGEKIEKLEETVPRNQGELWWDYYDRIGRQVAPILDVKCFRPYGVQERTALHSWKRYCRLKRQSKDKPHYCENVEMAFFPELRRKTAQDSIPSTFYQPTILRSFLIFGKECPGNNLLTYHLLTYAEFDNIPFCVMM